MSAVDHQEWTQVLGEEEELKVRWKRGSDL